MVYKTLTNLNIFVVLVIYLDTYSISVLFFFWRRRKGLKQSRRDSENERRVAESSRGSFGQKNRGYLEQEQERHRRRQPPVSIAIRMHGAGTVWKTSPASMHSKKMPDLCSVYRTWPGWSNRQRESQPQANKGETRMTII